MSKTIIFVGFLFLGQFLSAQTSTDTIKDLPAEQVEVIKQFEAMLDDARKVNTIPEPPAQRVLEKFEYKVNVRPLLLEYPEPVIKPIAVASRPKVKKYNGLLRVAAGNLNTLDAGLTYNFLTKQETEINFSGDYLTMSNVNERFQKVQKIGGVLSLNHAISSLAAFSGSIGYNQSDVGFYGSPLNTIATDTSIYFRKLVDYNIGFQIFNPSENEFGLDYSLGFDFNNFNLGTETLNENNFLINGLINKKLNEHFSVLFSGIADISSISDSTTQSYNNYLLSPVATYNSEYFKVEAGVSFAFASEKTHYLPDVEIAFSSNNYGFVPFIFWKGSLQKNNIQKLYAYNPFLSRSIASDIGNSVIMRYGLGARGKVKNLLYEASFAYGKTSDLILFSNLITEDNLRQFSILKDTSNIVDVELSAGYTLNRKLDLNANFKFTDYSIVAWHLPSYVFDLGLSYKMLNKKLDLSPSLFIRDGLTIRNDQGDAENLPYLLDFSLSSHYQIHEQFLVYAEINNILSSEYQQWYDYSNFGINAKLGVKLKF